MMYPKIFIPLLNLAKWRRIKIHASEIPDVKIKVKSAIANFCEEYPIKQKINLSTVLRMFFDFGLSVF